MCARPAFSTIRQPLLSHFSTRHHPRATLHHPTIHPSSNHHLCITTHHTTTADRPPKYHLCTIHHATTTLGRSPPPLGPSTPYLFRHSHQTTFFTGSQGSTIQNSRIQVGVGGGGGGGVEEGGRGRGYGTWVKRGVGGLGVFG